MISINDFDNPKSLEAFFINYLHMKGIYSIYMSNFKNSHLQPYSFSEFVKDIYDHKNLKSFISGAFTWSGTEQRHDFWSGQSIDFVNYMRTSDIRTFEILANCWED